MSAAVTPLIQSNRTEAVPQRKNYLNSEHGTLSWLFTLDHKRIALLYLASVSFFFLVGGLLAMAIRMQLLPPGGEMISY